MTNHSGKVEEEKIFDEIPSNLHHNESQNIFEVPIIELAADKNIFY